MLHMGNASVPEGIKNEYLRSREFKENLIMQNNRKGKMLAIIVIAFEVAFILAASVFYSLTTGNLFQLHSCQVMYFVMIVINLLYLLLLHRYDQKQICLNTMDVVTVVFLTLFMTWGGVASLLDRTMDGQTVSFMVNMIICSTVYCLDAKKMGISYLVSTSILAIGLPFFRNSIGVLMGNYINLAVFVVVSWAATRINYRSHCDNYVIKRLMNQSNALLANEMKENMVINQKLAIANERLKKLALLDELTGLPNRRGFREFIDKNFQDEAPDRTVSVIMMDVDHFKQYNDYYGHGKGDHVLIAVAEQIGALVGRKDQIAIRWGGEEFVYAAFHTNREEIIKIAETIQAQIQQLQIPNQASLVNPHITISLGTCTGKISSPSDIGKIINIADQALYLAKEKGRNCVETLACSRFFDEESFE
jgi:diguanylate cyclase (GGDEF)-like protein